MRVVYIGCVDFSYALLAKILTFPDIEVVGVVTRESSKFHADFRCLKSLADEIDIPCFLDSKNQQTEMAAWMASLDPDVVYCFGWPCLLGRSILEIPSLGVIGYHPTALPKNRGRHPIIWTLALGLTETASTFFFMDEGADSGDVLSQEVVEVKRADNAMTLYAKLKEIAIKQMQAFTPCLASGRFSRRPQNHANANYWRKRCEDDGRIDWRMCAEGIYNLVRALTKPYLGAHVQLDALKIRVWDCEVATARYSVGDIENLEPGRVLKVSPNGIDVRCSDGVVRLKRHEFQQLPGVGVCL